MSCFKTFAFFIALLFPSLVLATCPVKQNFKQSFPNYAFLSNNLTVNAADCCLTFMNEEFCLKAGSITFKKGCGSPWFLKVETVKGLNITQSLFDIYLKQEALAWLACKNIVDPPINSVATDCSYKKSSMDVETSTSIFLTSTCPGFYHCTNGYNNVNGAVFEQATFTLPNALETLYFCQIIMGEEEESFWVVPGSADVCVYMGIRSIHSFLICNYPVIKYVWIAFLIILTCLLARVLFCLALRVIILIYVGYCVLRGKRTWDTEVVRYNYSDKSKQTKTKSVMLTALLLSLFTNPASAYTPTSNFKEVSLSSLLSSSNITVCTDLTCSVNLITSFYLKPEKGTCFTFTSSLNPNTSPVKTYVCISDFYYSYPLLEEYQTADPSYSHYLDGYCIGSPIVTCPEPVGYGYVKNFYFNSDINQGCWIWGQTDICATTTISFGPRYYIYSLGQPTISLTLEVYQKIDGSFVQSSDIGTVTTVGSFFESKPFTLLNGEKIIQKPNNELDVGFAPSKYAVEPFRWGSYQFSDNENYFPGNPFSFTSCTGPNGGFKCTANVPLYDYKTVLPKSINTYNTLGFTMKKGNNLLHVPFTPANMLFTINTNFSLSFSNDKPCPKIVSVELLNNFYGLGKSNPVKLVIFSTCVAGPAQFTAEGCSVSATSSCFISTDQSECFVDVVLPSTVGKCTLTSSGLTSSSATFDFNLVKETTLVPVNQTSTNVGNVGSAGLSGFTYGLPNYLLYIIFPIIAFALMVALGFGIYYVYKKPVSINKMTSSKMVIETANKKSK